MPIGYLYSWLFLVIRRKTFFSLLIHTAQVWSFEEGEGRKLNYFLFFSLQRCTFSLGQLVEKILSFFMFFFCFHVMRWYVYVCILLEIHTEGRVGSSGKKKRRNYFFDIREWEQGGTWRYFVQVWSDIYSERIKKKLEYKYYIRYM